MREIAWQSLPYPSSVVLFCRKGVDTVSSFSLCGATTDGETEGFGFLASLGGGDGGSSSPSGSPDGAPASHTRTREQPSRPHEDVGPRKPKRRPQTMSTKPSDRDL